MDDLNASYWESRYQKQQTGWDIGYPNPALLDYFKKHTSKEKSILIPGAGHAYEAEWLILNGFQKVTILDWSETALNEALKRAPILERANLEVGDFFKHLEKYDLIVEQTFFCAIEPSLRESYAKHCKRLLNRGGVLMGLLFNFPLTNQGPPFGGSLEDYQRLFQPHFKKVSITKTELSIKPRQGREFFIELTA